MMIRKKRLTVAQQQALEYKQSAAVGIGKTRQNTKLEKRLAEAAQIAKTRESIFEKRPRCQVCDGLRPTRGYPDQMHEDPPRSKTRGLPPEQRFNEQVCGRVCAPCHQDLTHHRITVVFLSDQGFAGPLRIVR